MPKWFVLLGLSFGPLAFSQSVSEFYRIDAWASSFVPNGTDLGLVVQELTSPAQNEVEKVRAIYAFVVNYIEYDQEAFRDGNQRINVHSRDVLRRKKAVCWGFAELVRELCLQAGIPAWTVSGYVRLPDEQSSSQEAPDHAWNVVLVEGQYRILEPTWASSARRQQSVVDDGKDPYFFPDPKAFIHDHLPVMDMFQLLDCVRSWSDFVAKPKFIPDSAQCGYQFRDTLQTYRYMSSSEQKMYEASSAFRQNPSYKNKSAWGHALVDVAVQVKERADSLYERESYKNALTHFEQASALFHAGEEYTSLYDWQLEAWGLGELNRAQLLYRQQYEQRRREYPEVIANFHQARKILNQIKHPGFNVRQAQQFIDRYLQALE